MKLRVVSDLHFEFHADGGEGLLNSLKLEDPDWDALVIAGDLCSSAKLLGSLFRVRDRIKGRPLVYVTGNHEYYGATLEVVDKTVRDWFHAESWKPLERDVIEINGRRILGCTLWFPFSDETKSNRQYMNDFYQIKKLEPEVYDRCYEARAWLKRELREGDIVVTHHLPSQQSVSDRFKRSALNCYFVCDVEDLIRECKPALWIHGHTHDHKDYKIGNTRIVCNPCGYPGESVQFDPVFTVEV